MAIVLYLTIYLTVITIVLHTFLKYFFIITPNINFSSIGYNF